MTKVKTRKNIKFTKSHSIEYAKSHLSIFKVPELLCFNAISIKQEMTSIVEQIKYKFNKNIIIVRSSAADEDVEFRSAAGEYDSILNIPANNQKKVTKAINKVVASYEKKRSLLLEDEVIIQAMVQNSTMSGVIFTHDLNTGAPYYVINYDDQSGSTDTVTSGNGEYANHTLYIHRNSINSIRSERFNKLLLAVLELEQLMDSQFLDIEFALGEDLTPYLLQVRTITTQPNWNRAVARRVDATLKGVQTFVRDRLKKTNGLYGESTVLGQMPDWNPVEMLGRAPRALANSLYQKLITNHAWQRARETMGYAVPTGQPLMVTLAGQPFIDTRLSFHSYLPKMISPIIAEKLVNRWIMNLKSSPELHDKIEFEIAITTYSFDIDEKIEKLVGDALTINEKEEFKQAHLQQTIRLLTGDGQGSIAQALEKINHLKQKQIEASNSQSQHKLSLLFAMVDDCIRMGTTPFAILARHGFIAKTILLSLYRRGMITYDEVNQIQASVQTVAGDLVNDMRSLQMGTLSNSEFMAMYGHLRPGTYDIMSHRYDQMADLVETTVTSPHLQQPIEPFEFSKKQNQQIDRLLAQEGFNEFNANTLLDYIHEATIAREYGKFVFTKSVSDILELIAIFGEEHGLSRDEMSHIPIDNILNLAITSSEKSIEKKLRVISVHEAEKHDISVAIRLPQLLTDEAGVHIVPFQVSHPNFITHKKITASCIMLHSEMDSVSLCEKVVIIEGADPGFDWIFSQKIAGLITKYGGANSHMAIRCAEFGIPAAIGCGEQRFDQLLKSNKVHLDCAAGLVNPVH